MLVCLCKILTERELRAAIHAGARSIGEVGAATGAGTDCGSCREMIAQILADEGVESREPHPPALGRSVSTDPSHPAADAIRKERRQ